MLNKSLQIVEFVRARTALKYGLLLLGATRESVVLIPDYLCNVVWHPLLQLGLRVQTYPLLDNLSVNWSALEEIQQRQPAWALLMVHYFGQPQNVGEFRRFCVRNNLKLIEDAAHGHGGKFKGQLLGTFGDIGISSPRKFLNLSSGGYLYLPCGSVKLIDVGQGELGVAGEGFVDFLKSKIIRFPTLNGRLRALSGIFRDWSDPFLFQESEKRDFLTTPTASLRIQQTDWSRVAQLRRSNWQIWHEVCVENGLRPVFDKVWHESCPWVFPVYAQDLVERNRWLIWGSKHAIPLSTWPALPTNVIEESGKSLARWQRLLCFPLDAPPPQYKRFLV